MKSVLFSLVFLVSLHANAKLVVVTDIDDTLRATNRLYGSYSEQLANILDYSQSFSGAKQLLDVLNQQGAEIYYVTAAVTPMYEISMDYLSYNQFPQNQNFYFKSWLEYTEDYKVYTIENIIYQEKPDALILIGDNGEMDIPAYERVRAKFPNTAIFIHMLYKGGTSTAVPEKQLPYITYAEVAAYLEQYGVFKSEESKKVIEQVLADTVSTEEAKQLLVLPSWSDVDEMDILNLFSVPMQVDTNNQVLLDNIENGLKNYR